MKRLVIKGTLQEVKEIIESMIERYGKETTITELLEKFDKEELILV